MSEPEVPRVAELGDRDEAVTRPRVPALRREAVLPSERRGGLGAVALLCSLAGVASGFALATTILATQLAQSEGRMVRVPVREQAFLGIEERTAKDGSARIVRIHADTPAAAIGLAVGDHIVRYNGEKIDRPYELGSLVRRSRIGSEATVEVRRGTTKLVLQPTLAGAMLPVR